MKPGLRVGRLALHKDGPPAGFLLKGREEWQVIIRRCDNLGMEDKQLALNPTIEKVALIAGTAAGASILGYLLYRAWKSGRMCPLASWH